MRLVVAVTAKGPKKVGSTEGMERSRKTSPLYDAWVDKSVGLARKIKRALKNRDLDTLGAAMEQSTFSFHACAMSSSPSILYWQPGTMSALRAVEKLRERGVSAWATMDAGPHVKVLCHASDARKVRNALKKAEGVLDTMVAKPGGPIEIRATMKVSAPGKMMISGEYAVLEGAPAIVAAVQTRALAWVFDGAEHEDRASEKRFPEAFASAAIAAEALGTEAPPFRVDVSELRRAGQKLGVGSSSAAAAAAAALVYALADAPLDDPGVLRAALDGHREVAPSGSGADVAACTLGGFVRYQRKAGTWDVSATPVEWPEGLGRSRRVDRQRGKHAPARRHGAPAARLAAERL